MPLYDPLANNFKFLCHLMYPFCSNNKHIGIVPLCTKCVYIKFFPNVFTTSHNILYNLLLYSAKGYPISLLDEDLASLCKCDSILTFRNSFVVGYVYFSNEPLDALVKINGEFNLSSSSFIL